MGPPEPPVEAKEPQTLGDGEDELVMRSGLADLAGDALGRQRRPFLAGLRIQGGLAYLPVRHTLAALDGRLKGDARGDLRANW